MKILYAATLSILTLMGTGTRVQAKDCEVPRFQTADNQTVDGKMRVKAGKRCTVRLGVGVGGFSDAKILKEPKQGTVEIRGYDIIYTPKKNYSGNDEFTYARNRIDIYGGKALRTVNMKIEVFP